MAPRKFRVVTPAKAEPGNGSVELSAKVPGSIAAKLGPYLLMFVVGGSGTWMTTNFLQGRQVATATTRSAGADEATAATLAAMRSEQTKRLDAQDARIDRFMEKTDERIGAIQLTMAATNSTLTAFGVTMDQAVRRLDEERRASNSARNPRNP